ncbi:hypothetical protein E8P82_04295 [Arthrobacter echini]|uniref:Uncharacterized protein n=1 Tax=Arthrobacter echini TaxID=1529066 RepID=A0A4S5E6T6_9MICC|nr:hypothetical protein [Arthrobacter echini]THJ67336.1 hypothetical protein E8P82_04295 [Arthrobacter echini]
MSSHAPAVLAIGSCRIFRPLRRLSDLGSIQLVNQTHHNWFTHTAAAARQFVEISEGRTIVPEPLRGAAFETMIGYEAEMSGEIPSFDLAVVEVSTVKQHSAEGIELNAHRVYNIAKELGIEYRPVVNGDVSQVPDGHPLKGMTVSRASAESIAADIRALRDQLAVPILTVDHLYFEIEGEPMAERTSLTQVLESVADGDGVMFHPTKPVIVEHGVDVALADSNHYRKEFETVVAERMYASILRAASRSVS